MSSTSITNHLVADDNDNENDEDDDGRKENDVELKLNESLPPEQYREPILDKNQKMKIQLEVSFIIFLSMVLFSQSKI